MFDERDQGEAEEVVSWRAAATGLESIDLLPGVVGPLAPGPEVHQGLELVAVSADSREES